MVLIVIVALRDEISQLLGNAYWPVPLRVAARLLGLWVRILPGSWLFVSCECCVFSGRALRVRLITRPETSCRVWRVKRVWSRSPVSGGHDLESGRSATKKKKKVLASGNKNVVSTCCASWTGICLETSISMHQQNSILLMISVPITNRI